MQAVAAVHPTFTGVYVTPGESPGAHVNAAGFIDAPAVVALIDSLFSAMGSFSGLGQHAARGVAAHRVAYTYVQLDEWKQVAGQALFADGPHLRSIGMDQHGTIRLGFGPGISVEEIERRLAALNVPRDALVYRGGTVLESGPASVPRR